SCLFSVIARRDPLHFTLVPYTTLFRSRHRDRSGGEDASGAPAGRTAALPAGAGPARSGPPGTHRPGGGTTGLLNPAPLTSRHIRDRKSTRLNSSHVSISYAVFCLKKKN